MLALTDMNGVNVTGAPDQNGLFASSVYDAENDRIYIKVINVSDREQPVTVRLDGLRKKEYITGVEAVSFHSDDPDAENTLDQPLAIVPETLPLDFSSNVLDVTVSPETFMVYVLQVNRK